MIKFVCCTYFLLFSISSLAQSVIVHDISSAQLTFMQRYYSNDSLSRSNIFLDSLYMPNKIIWDGYLGSGDAMIEWTNRNLSTIATLQNKAHSVSVYQIKKDLILISAQMQKLTGINTSGEWYVLYGPAWTDLGSLGGTNMIIDLNHVSNASNERIRKILPHELTHQIMSAVNVHKDTTAIASIVGEGFAVWMNQFFWDESDCLSDHLGYTDEELELCDKNLEALKGIYRKYSNSSDPDIIDLFRNRNSKLNEKLPGAIGYYIGYRIVEAYIQKFGKDSFKEIFIKSQQQVADESGF